MIDLHYHLLPGIDDGAADMEQALAMARLSVIDGVTVIACTPHIFPGVYDNSGPDIRRRVESLQTQLDGARINIRLVTGGDVHVAPDLVAKLRSGHALTLNDSRYLLVEPPHHVLPPNLEVLFFNLLAAGYVPILTHPERMSWIERDYDMLVRLVRSGAWMQLTAGAVVGKFGFRAKRWSERMLREGLVHIVASDAHDTVRRPPLMGEAYRALRSLVGDQEALNLVRTRPQAILNNVLPSAAPGVPHDAPNGAHDDHETVWNRVARYIRAS